MLHKFQPAVLCIFQAGCKQYPMPLSARMTACEPISRSLRRRPVRRPLPERKADEKAEKAGHDRHGGRIRIITAQAK